MEWLYASVRYELNPSDIWVISALYPKNILSLHNSYCSFQGNENGRGKDWGWEKAGTI